MTKKPEVIIVCRETSKIRTSAQKHFYVIDRKKTELIEDSYLFDDILENRRNVAQPVGTGK